jgi:iron uptake system component EfeO
MALRTFRQVLAATAAVVAAATSLAACGGGGSGALPEPPAGTDVVVTAYDIGIREASLPTVKAGSVSFFYRDEGTSHTLKIKDAAGKDVPGFLLHVTKRGDSDAGRANLQPGEYIVYCSIPGHYALMHRTLTVQ